MTGKMACICLLAAGTVLSVGLPQMPAQSAGSGPSSGQSAFGETPRLEGREACGSPTGGSVTIFFTGNELGAMQPCGCSGG